MNLGFCMTKFLLGMLFFLQVPFVFAQDNHCALKLYGYKLIKDSVYPFTIENEKACFFAYYTTNPAPMI